MLGRDFPHACGRLRATAHIRCAARGHTHRYRGGEPYVNKLFKQQEAKGCLRNSSLNFMTTYLTCLVCIKTALSIEALQSDSFISEQVNPWLAGHVHHVCSGPKIFTVNNGRGTCYNQCVASVRQCATGTIGVTNGIEVGPWRR